MKIVLLDTMTFGDAELGGFDALGEVKRHDVTMPEHVARRIAGAEVIVTNKVVITEAVMQATPTLKLICVAATGMNNVDLDAAGAHGIAVKNVAGYSTDSVVQHTFSMLFYLVGHSRYYDEFVKRGQWQHYPVFSHLGPSFFELNGKRWGIIGLGTIGRAVARVATAFGAQVCYFSTSGRNDDPEFERVDLKTLLRRCDVVSIHAPLNAETTGLLRHDELMMLKDGAVLLNLGRGGIVDEEALAAIIDAKPIHVGLDVLAVEPMSDPHPLMQVVRKECLYVSPHIAWSSVEARDRLIGSVIDHIRTYQEGVKS